MSVWRLILREVTHRKLNFALALFSALMAVACLVGTLVILEAKETVVEKRGAKLKDDYRKITKGLGFNILILPKDQNLHDVYAEHYAQKLMPEEYVNRLAQSKIMTIEHLLPILEQRIEWPEHKRTILLTGVRGEVPYVNRSAKKPLLKPVQDGQIVLGYELHSSLGLKKGDALTLLGRAFTVGDTYAQRGNKDDITAWINLKDAQELLDKPQQINAIWALECNCATQDRLAEIRNDVAAVLPETQVIETVSTAVARAEARNRAVDEAKLSLSDFKSFAAVMLPLVTIACGVWIGLLALGNVRSRRYEIGILRAVGFRSRQILIIFLGKAMFAGLVGAVLGTAVGMGVGSVWLKQATAGMQELAGFGLFDASLLEAIGVVVLAAPLVAALATWLPALVAAGQDPAAVLSEE